MKMKTAQIKIEFYSTISGSVWARPRSEKGFGVALQKMDRNDSWRATRKGEDASAEIAKLGWV